jgi:hypothetical protein
MVRAPRVLGGLVPSPVRTANNGEPGDPGES